MSETAVKAGDRLSLTLRLPKQMFPVSIESATVRWTKDHTFGVEFMTLSPVAQMRLRKFMTHPQVRRNDRPPSLVRN